MTLSSVLLAMVSITLPSEPSRLTPIRSGATIQPSAPLPCLATSTEAKTRPSVSRLSFLIPAVAATPPSGIRRFPTTRQAISTPLLEAPRFLVIPMVSLILPPDMARSQPTPAATPTPPSELIHSIAIQPASITRRLVLFALFQHVGQRQHGERLWCAL